MIKDLVLYKHQLQNT